MVKKKIIALTGNRADYDLLSYLYKYLNKDKEIDFSLIVTGAHLTAGYENSVLRMKKDGNKILVAIENILNSDRQGSRAKATGLLTSSLSDVLSNNVPDLFIVP
ncbi:MAG: UDP-N-acetylglucosamine 2-epimerase (hydrolyzing), partial [Clostridiales Family XIII bacterium]|nr:UDP-N-acetylglucosamine 2-epimerase (hydrolyzing) [Clostridiales Family XIII bacterium]